jgi:cytochrome c biogenesis protein CcmG/thiol:disulfide interchange protein DsbE
VSAWLIGFVAIIVTALIIYGLANQPSLEGERAPDLTVPLLTGGEITLSALRGQPVVLNFWSSWCEPCRAEAPALERAYQAYRDRGVAFLGIDVKDVKEKGIAFVETYGLSYPNGYDPRGKASRAYKLTGVPETLFITREGIVAKRHIGQISEDGLRTAIDALLSAPPVEEE